MGSPLMSRYFPRPILRLPKLGLLILTTSFEMEVANELVERRPEALKMLLGGDGGSGWVQVGDLRSPGDLGDFGMLWSGPLDNAFMIIAQRLLPLILVSFSSTASSAILLRRLASAVSRRATI